MKNVLAVLLFFTVLLTCVGCTNTDNTEQLNGGYNSGNSNWNNQNQYGQNNQNQYGSGNNGNNYYTTNSNVNNEYNEVESYCDRLVSQGDAASAYKFAKAKADVDSSYNSLLIKYSRIYVEERLNTAKSYANCGDYQSAVNILKEANRVYSCSEFSAAISEYTSFMPCKLPFCTRVDSEDYQYMLYAEDCFGNTYQEVFGFVDSYGGEKAGYAVFDLNGKYKNLSGVFAGSTNLYKDMEVSCKIYADGQLIYESVKLGRTSPPININLNVAGVQQLRIEYMWYTWWTSDPCCIFDLTVS